jgi:hypothetical protein
MAVRRRCFVRLCALSIVVLWGGIGCVRVPVKPPFAAHLDNDAKTRIKTVSVSRDIRFPERMTVLATHKRAPGGILNAYIAGKFENHWSGDFDRLIKEKVDIEQYFSQNLYNEFVAELKERQLFTYVPAGDKTPPDAEFVLTVEIYGLDPLRKTPGRGPYVLLSAMLIGSPPYVLIPSPKSRVSLEPDNPDRNPVLWYRQVRVCNPKEPIFAMYEMEEYVRRPELLKEAFEMAIGMAVDYLLKNLTET